MEVNFYEMYLEEMALIPVLEAEEEKQVLILAAAGDKDAKKRLVEGSLAKVAQMVKEYEGRELPMSDVIQEANVALTAAAAAYDGSQQWQEFLEEEIRQAVEAALEEQKNRSPDRREYDSKGKCTPDSIPGYGQRTGKRGNRSGIG